MVAILKELVLRVTVTVRQTLHVLEAVVLIHASSTAVKMQYVLLIKIERQFARVQLASNLYQTIPKQVAFEQ